MTKNHFAVLGLKPGVTGDEVKKSFRTLAKKWHPDKNCSDIAEEKFKEIAAAYDYLQSQDKREILARDLSQQDDKKKTTANSTWKQSETFSSESKPTAQPKKESKEPKSEKKSESHWTRSFFGKGKKPSSTRNFGRKWNVPPNNEPTSFYTSQPSKFSAAFQSFVDQLDCELEGDFGSVFGSRGLYSDSRDLFTDDFDPFDCLLTNLKSKKKNKAPPNARHVAPEMGDVEDINEEYLFTTRKTDDSDMSSDGEFHFDADKAAAKIPCRCCGQLHQRYKLAHHESRCGKFDVSSSEDDSDSDEFDYGQHFKPSGDWRQIHSDLLRKIRRDKRRAKFKASQEDSVTCTWCGKSFDRQTAAHHIPFCAMRQHRSPTHNKSRKPAESSKFDKSKQYSKRTQRSWKKPDISSQVDSGTSSTDERASPKFKYPFHKKERDRKYTAQDSESTASDTLKQSSSNNRQKGSKFGGGVRGTGLTTPPCPKCKSSLYSIATCTVVSLPILFYSLLYLYYISTF